MSEIKNAKKADERLGRRVAAAIAAGNLAKAKSLTNQRVKSRSLKLAAADLYNRKLRPERRLSPEALVELAHRVNLFQPSTEVARIVRRPKGSGFRRTFDHAPADRIAHFMIRLAIEPFAALDVQPYQFAALPGRGSAFGAAIAAVRHHVERGFAWALETDIQDCYGSFDQQEIVRMIPLPPAVVNARIAPSFIMVRDISVDGSGPQSSRGRAVRRASLTGLTQGASASAIVAAMLLGQILDGLEVRLNDAVLLVWSDNILLLGKTSQAVYTTLQDLRSELIQHPAGPLPTTDRALRHIDEGFEWIGFKFRRKPDGDLLVTPSPFKMREFSNEVFFKTTEAIHYAPALVHYQQWLNGWRSHYRYWPNCMAWTRRVIEVVARKEGVRPVWNRRGALVRFVFDDPYFDRLYPMQSDDDFSYVRRRVPYWGDMPETEVTKEAPWVTVRREMAARQIEQGGTAAGISPAEL